jgi:DNA primase
MGTALTARQLRELSRLTRRVWLCFDSDAAGEEATLRGMEAAVANSFEVKVVALEPGSDPADSPVGFEERLAGADPYPLYRVRTELRRAPDPQVGFERARAVLNRVPDSPERHEAWRYANDKLGMTIQLQRGVTTTAVGEEISPRLLEASARLERDALAGVAAHPDLRQLLESLSPEHFDADLHRRARTHLLEQEEQPDEELVPLLAELDARAAAGGIDEDTGRELLLRLRERQLRRELAGADPERTKELQEQLEKIRATAANLA